MRRIRPIRESPILTALRQASRRFAARADFEDALTLGGAALVGYGGWLHYPPLGFAAGGGCLLLVWLVPQLTRKA